MGNTTQDANTRFKRVRKIIRGVLFGLIGLFLLLTTVLVVSAFNDLPPLGELENPQMDLSTQIWSADGKLIGSLHTAEDRIFTPLEEISPYVIDALIATEDIRFRNHSGIDPKTLPSMLYRNLLKGQKSGGSSISQQLARNLYDQIGRSKTFSRKIKEAIVAVILESRFTKDEIIQAYLNTTSFYGSTYGIELGAQTLFGKSAAKLKQHEACLMVGLLKGPSYYSPIRHPDRCKDRRNTVIGQLEKYGYLNKKSSDSLQALPLGINFHPGGGKDAMASYFKSEVKTFLQTWMKANNKDYNIYSDGLKVYTTIDSRMQRYAEKAVEEHLSGLQGQLDKELRGKRKSWKPANAILTTAMERTERYRKAINGGYSKNEIKKQFQEKLPMRIWTYQGEVDTTMSPQDSLIHYMKFLKTGFMAMDPQTGEIKSWVGGINWKYFKYDHVYEGKRQVGSTFKPFVYTAAMENGFTPCTKIPDMSVSIKLPDGKYWRPQNSGGKDVGITDMKTGLALSKNKVTAGVMKRVGASKVCELAKRMGIKSKLDCVPSIALGTTDLSVFEMVGAYGTFANGGVHTSPRFISRIEDKYGNILYTGKMEQREAIDSTTAFTMVNMMMGVVDNLQGTAHRLRTKYKFSNQMGGKTGTTQGNSDGWFMGLTPNLVGGVWVGCDDNRIHFRSTRLGQGANMALPIWAIFLKYVYADKKIGLPQEPFLRPKDYNVQLVCENPKVDRPAYTKDSLPEELFPD